MVRAGGTVGRVVRRGVTVLTGAGRAIAGARLQRALREQTLQLWAVGCRSDRGSDRGVTERIKQVA